tara:strand:- start:524 stop:952 length:429 start_codon:yes stop_codon:yes gene_type:complete
MSCIICKKPNEAWLLLKNDKLYTDVEGKNIGETIQTCSYLCTRKCDTKLPENYSPLVMNKGDFCYLRPIVSKENYQFEILTYEEIQSMTDIEKENYYQQKDKNISLDAYKDELYEELEREDMNTFCIENQEFNSSDGEYDDY